MRIALRLDDGPLRRRVIRVLSSFPDVLLDDEATLIAGGRGDISLPGDPLAHLASLLADEVRVRSGNAATSTAATQTGEPLRSGTRVVFPPPVGPLWATEDGDLVRAPTDGGYAGAVASNEALSLAVTDDTRYLEAIVTAAPIIAGALECSELTACTKAGLSLAERATAAT